MNSIESRKQLLVAESEINRAELAKLGSKLKTGLQPIAESARTFYAVASSGVEWVAKISSLQRGNPFRGETKPAWVQNALKGLGLISTIWLAVRSRRKGAQSPDGEK